MQPNEPKPVDPPVPTTVETSFGDLQDVALTANTTSASGPVAVGDRVLAYEIGDPWLCAWAVVTQHAPKSGRISLVLTSTDDVIPWDPATDPPPGAPPPRD